MSDLAAARARYVERIAKRERISSKRLLEALAAVPREDFLARGPWRIKSEAARSYRLTPDADPVHLYDNVLVAIDARRKLDTGLPSLWAHFIDLLDVGDKDHVVQIGCGLGYFSAVLSKIVGPKGSVRAIECDERLAARAANFLRAYRNVEVVQGDGCEDIGAPADVIIVHAGFSHPHPLWLQSLRPRGRLLVPLTQRDREGAVIRITRRGKGFEAEPVQQIRIFPGRGRGTTALDDRVADWWQRASALAPLRFRGIEQGLPSDG
ncbi:MULTISPECIES: protein-L-isoaspartate O-methyltransferase family protein [Bradyrhizobium]|uniref:Protein-L-isoaspartate O-methyltransferase n=1 Tax=Bradyrhizobium diazoefficiens (strain JCM 10833 / BCRC 13528 / IAM 13628 / NBRC 14792 / USDA 110) TaxID=224911 RepID=Q89T11_BRADU|nr:rRNA adenine N-6-methyltransferase family protein [Bradyrhizobium diazoefficiens]MBP1058924.1 protein-L-isoaspartate(D-aspartate) O-methyltransferase [Bradyrhizobium japonicum]AND87767.1 methyltransferase [Bradyrhizobium diazoefficiens USDA 110]AWO89286.1 methyltransferase [Bradyrhizobium diazoefficiens]PDT57819.1 methyltransferase [Bradyrhizobium diazoefficiens]QBP21067.1 methyltransferase [Bradyrhizobium diazoefficiens]